MILLNDILIFLFFQKVLLRKIGFLMIKFYFKMGILKIYKLKNFCKINIENQVNFIGLQKRVYNGSIFFFVDQQFIRFFYINEIINGYVFQVLGYFIFFRKFGVDIFEIYLL